jgi:hypothetical protein
MGSILSNQRSFGSIHGKKFQLVPIQNFLLRILRMQVQNSGWDEAGTICKNCFYRNKIFKKLKIFCRCYACDTYLDLKRYSINSHDLKDKNVYCNTHAPRNNLSYYVVREPKFPISSEAKPFKVKTRDDIQPQGKNNGLGRIRLSIDPVTDNNQLQIIVHEAK